MRLREVKFSFACQKRTRKAPAISTRWTHEKGAARPFQTPKELSKPKNASRFAKRIFLCFSHLRLRRRFHVSAGRYRQQRRNTRCEAANRRNEKKAFSAAASFFPFRQLLWGLKGASSPFLVGPARRNRWWFSGSLLARKRELSPAKKRSDPAPPARQPFLVLFWCANENLALRNSALLYYTPNPPDFYDQIPKASIFRPSATLQGRASVLYFL